MSTTQQGAKTQQPHILDVSSSSKYPAFIKHEPRMVLGEGIQYRPSDKTLHYLDIERSPVTALFIAQLNDEGNLVSKPRMVEIKGSRHVTALAFRKDKPKSYLCTTNTGLAYLSEETGGLQDLPNGFGQIIPADQAEKMRFNDAYCDSKGHFYFHSMSRDESQPKGKLYMYTSDMKSVSDLKVLEEDFAIGNGPVVDEERKRLYFNTTPNGIGYVYDWDPETGLIRDKREFFNNNKRRPSSLFDPLTTAVGPGFPDGHTLDSAGNVYQAVFARGLIERFTPERINDLTIKLPARFPTCPIFGGKDLKQLYITTASEALQPGEKELAGDLGGCILKLDLSEFMPQAEGLVKPLFNA